jgi:hypothetical protein
MCGGSRGVEEEGLLLEGGLCRTFIHQRRDMCNLFIAESTVSAGQGLHVKILNGG